MAASKDSYYAGRDVKSVALNIASTLLLSLPVILFFLENVQHRWIVGGCVVLTVLIAVLIPPVGYFRPHPYSDFDSNRLTTNKKTS